MSDQQKYIGVGDIHGCAESLSAMLEKLEEYSDRTIVFIGDYIDRGPDSKRSVDLLLKFREDHDCIFLRGNHEQMLLDAHQIGDFSLWMMNGGRVTLNSYDTDVHDFDISDSHMEFYRQTRMYYDTENYFFVHAGLKPYKTIRESIENGEDVESFLWERSHLDAPETAWEKTVVFGHTPKRSPFEREKMIGIDTGCVFRTMGYGKLTSVLLPEEEYIQQDCIDI
ncbi:MAG: metallophosphoesterase family protein [Balneolaceae bacterium]|nr:metallophosphoesterase family protein [Balneolaceae bacterium]